MRIARAPKVVSVVLGLRCMHGHTRWAFFGLLCVIVCIFRAREQSLRIFAETKGRSALEKVISLSGTMLAKVRIRSHMSGILTNE